MDTLTVVDRNHEARPEESMAASVSVLAKSRFFDSVLCFGDSDWWYHNRGHADMQFMRRFARLCPTVYVNSLGMEMPKVAEGRMFTRKVLRKLRSVGRYYGDGGDGFGVMTPIHAPLGNKWAGGVMASCLALQLRTMLRIRGMRRPLIWAVCPTAALVLERMAPAGVVYQLSDAYGALNANRNSAAENFEAALARRADLILCASLELQRRARDRYGRGEYLDHGVDYDLFASAALTKKPVAEIPNNGKPRIGFFGNIDGNTVDLELLDGVIAARPNYQFVLIGPMASDFDGLRRHSNLTCIPQKPYREIAQYGAALDVCLMPWLDNEWIRHCNPIKLKEYLALGKPVVSTPFPELRRVEGLCYEARGVEEFVRTIDRAIAEDCDAQRERRQSWASNQTWDAKFNRVLELLAEHGISYDD